jgi:DNA replication protein
MDGCPWILNDSGNAEKCEIFADIKLRERISKMVHGDRWERNGLTFDEFKYDINPIQSEVKVIQKFWKVKEDIMMLISNNGTGKTHILQGLLYDYMKTGLDCSYITAKKLRRCWVTRDANYELFIGQELDQVLQNFLDSRFLFIDEVGGEGVTKSDHFESNFIDLLKSGYRKIIIASNLEPEEIFQDNRTLSILSGSVFIRWEGKDYRGLKNRFPLLGAD